MITTFRDTDLLGSWRLFEWTLHYPARGEISRPFGARPDGLLLYGSDGWMSVFLYGVGGEPPQTRQVSYAGRWWVENECVIHELHFAWRADWVGSTQRRRVSFSEGVLGLQAAETDDQGRQRVHHLLWRRQQLEGRGKA